MRYLATVLIFCPLLAGAGDLRGRFGAPGISRLPNVTARLISIGPIAAVQTSPIGPDGSFHFSSAHPGSFVLEAKVGTTRFFVTVVQLKADREVDVGTILEKELAPCEPPACFSDDFGVRLPPTPPRVLGVCDALKDHDRIWGQRLVIIGLFEDSPLGPILTGRCKEQFISGGYSWINALGLPGFVATGQPDLSQVADWNKIPEPQKLSRVASAFRKFNRHRDIRLVAVYGELTSEVGIQPQRCRQPLCAADIQFPPADLIQVEGFRQLK